jgi:hypothetical protein
MQTPSPPADLHPDISSFSSVVENEVSVLSPSSISAVATSSYISSYLQRLLKREEQNFVFQKMNQRNI